MFDSPPYGWFNWLGPLVFEKICDTGHAARAPPNEQQTTNNIVRCPTEQMPHSGPLAGLPCQINRYTPNLSTLRSGHEVLVVTGA